MSKPYFQFSNISNIEVATFDNSLSNFYSQGIEGTIKEDIQNALDAKLTNSEDPIKLKITFDSVPKHDIPGIDEVFTHINSLKGANTYTTETIDYMKYQESIVNIPVLTIEDSNTKGLSGAKNGQSHDRQDTYGVYAYSKGVHSIEDNERNEISRGGSHGIGKIANNAASDIHLMYFANCDEYGNRHLGGTIQLIEHRVENQSYRSTGYFTDIIKNENNTKFYPFENKNFSPVFSKESRGLKIIIPYVREEFNNPIRIIRSICDNFFLAILNKRLEVSVKTDDKIVDINHSTLKSIVTNPEYYEIKNSEMKNNFTPLYVKTYLEKEAIPLTISNSTDEFNFNLYFTYDEEIPTGRVGIIRTIGMKIEDFKVKNNVRRPFNAILIGGPKEDKYLKSLENESHNKISENDIRDEREKINAKKFLSNLTKKMIDIISEYIENNSPTDGFINTSDLLFETETSFKNDLSKLTEIVNISTDDPIVKKVKKKEKRVSGTRTKNSDPIDPDNRGKRRPRKLQPANDKKNVSQNFILPADIVERAVVNDHEMIKFDFRELENSATWKNCNISFKVVDGMGIEHEDEMNLLNNYSNIFNFDSTKKYPFDSNKIKNVDINDGIVYLKLYFTNSYNKFLKFLYVVEVENDL